MGHILMETLALGPSRWLRHVRARLYDPRMSDAISLTNLLVYALATARLAALATGADEITAAPVLWLVGKINPAGLENGWRFIVAYGATCMWCTSMWIAAAIAPVVYWHGTEWWALIPASALAFSQIAGLLSGVGRD